MKKGLIFILFLAGCTTTSPHATTLQQARIMPSSELCVYSGEGAKYEQQVVEEKKLNCEKILANELSLRLKASSNVELCQTYADWSNVDLVEKEVKKRKVDCYKTLSLLYQRQQAEALQQANQQNKANAFLNHSAQMHSLNLQQQAIRNARRPIYTQCTNNPMGTNCTTY